MWHLTIVKTIHSKRVLYASLVIQLSQVCNQICYSKDANLKWKAFLARVFETCNVKPILRHKPEHIILHVGTNDVLNLPQKEIVDKILELKRNFEQTSKGCKVIILTSTYRFDNWKVGNTVNELTKKLINLNDPIVNNKNIRRKHSGYKGLHLNSYGS